MKRWIVLASVVAAGGLVVLLWKGFDRDPREVPFMLKGQPAPAFTIKRLDDGQQVSHASLLGRPMVINFWASWCGPCKYEHPVLEWGHREFGRQVAFLGVVHEDTEENARKYLAQHASGFPQHIDIHSRMAVDYGIAGVPETYFVDSRGIIIHKHVGPIDPKTLAANIRALTSEAAQ